METQQKQATSKFGNACKALMELAARLTTLVDGLIASCIEVAKAYPKVPITFTDLRLSAYRHMQFSTYTGKDKEFFNVYTGKSEKCMQKGEGKPKSSAATAVQEALARIAATCQTDKISELLGWVDTSDKEVAPSLGDLKQFKQLVTKSDKQTVVPTKIVGLTVNAPAATQWDMNKLDTQLARVKTALSDCESQKMVDQFTTEVAELANLICSSVQIENATSDKKLATVAS